MPDSRLGLSERWRMAALVPFTDAPTTTTSEWLRLLELGADAAVRVVLEHLFDVLTKNEYGRTEAYEDAVVLVEALIEQAKP